LDALEKYREVPSAVLSNAASIWPSGKTTLMELHHRGFKLRTYFTPEHGFSAQAADGKALADDSDPATGLPVISLYGAKLSPSPEDLLGIEVVFADLPNIGCRFYTYWWTITFMMEACAEAGKRLVLLDRPNISRRNREAMEGPVLEPECASFLGRWPMPLTYSHTYGELLQFFVKERQIDLDFEIIPIDTGEIPFVPPSPAIRTPETAIIYPFTGLFEGLNLNNGRGTDTPFFLLGAPWINADEFCSGFEAMKIPGIRAEKTSYTPVWSIFAGELCHGLAFTLTDKKTFRPVNTALRFMNYLSRVYPMKLKATPYHTAVNPSGDNHLDRLFGVKDAFRSFCSGNELNLMEVADLLDVSGWSTK
jgi:uncharacterized protein YbbC (DUF1343 family)